MVGEALLARLNTLPLQQPGAATRALVLANRYKRQRWKGVALFMAMYPVRVPPGERPVTVRDAAGRVVPSRVVDSELRPDPGLPPDKRMWAFELEVLVRDPVPPRTIVAFAATYEDSRESLAPAAEWDAAYAASRVNILVETDIHGGDIDLPASLDAPGGLPV